MDPEDYEEKLEVAQEYDNVLEHLFNYKQGVEPEPEWNTTEEMMEIGALAAHVDLDDQDLIDALRELNQYGLIRYCPGDKVEESEVRINELGETLHKADEWEEAAESLEQ